MQRATWYAQLAISTLVTIIGFLLTPVNGQNPDVGVFLVAIGTVLMGLAASQFYWKDEAEPAQRLAFAQRVLSIRDQIIGALRGIPNVTAAKNAARDLTNVAGEIAPELKTAHAIYREPTATVLPPTRRQLHAPH